MVSSINSANHRGVGGRGLLGTHGGRAVVCEESVDSELQGERLVQGGCMGDRGVWCEI
jgi:hypothetical protein